MADQESAPAPAQAQPANDITLQEFCMRASQTDKRVELLAGFEHSQRVAGVVKAPEVVFAARYVAFANQPA